MWNLRNETNRTCELRKRGKPRSSLNCREQADSYYRRERERGGLNRCWGLRRTLVMSTKWCVEVLNHYIVHLKPMLHCMLTRF